MAGGAVVGTTAAVSLALTWLAAWSAGSPPWRTTTWGHWDSGLYLQIADGGYSLVRCAEVGISPPDAWCGTAGWYPGYPYLARAVAELGVSTANAARIVTVVAHLALLALLWLGFLRHRPRHEAMLAMLLAAAAPGVAYHEALFPIAVTLTGVLACLALADRHRWWLAGAAGALAVVAYPSGVLLVAGAAAIATDPTVGDARARIRAVVTFTTPLLAAYALVLVNFERAVGRWDAWFLVQEKYGYAGALAPITWWRQVRSIWRTGDGLPPAIGAQTLLVAALMITMLVVAWHRRDELSTGERTSVGVALAFWLVPLSLGGQLSLYRAESLLVPAIIVLARARPAHLAALTTACAVVAVAMTRLFVTDVLV